MTEEHLRQLKEIIDSEGDFVGKKDIKYILWFYTSKPFFKKGQCFILDCKYRKVFGQKVRWACFEVLESYSVRSLGFMWWYRLKAVFFYKGEVRQ